MSERIAELDVPSLLAGFLRQRESRPDAVAIVDGDRRVSYRELAGAAAAVRRDLDAAGVRPEDRVGVSMARSWRVLAAILGVMSCGASYVPLDPSYPEARLTFMAGDSGLRVVCVDEPGGPVVDAGATPVVVSADVSEDGPLDGELATRSGYVIYTSGSTGQPKGVPIPQRHVLELFRGACASAFSFGPDDVWTLYHSYSFDFSVWEMWGALLFGGTLVVVSESLSRDPRRLLGLLEAERVSVLSQVPSPFKYLVRAYERQPCPLESLRYVVFGGEAMDKPSTRRWLTLRDGAEQLVNMYGITETTVHVTAAVVGEDDVADDAGPTRIGRPLPHLDVALVDEDGAPVADGNAGEMLVSGSTLSPGYLNRPDLTAERFPTLDADGEPRRWYRSGDLARRDGDGELYYLGRVDSQVNLRGFRIELGEIEAALRDGDEVADAAATVAMLPGGERSLVALVVLAEGVAEPRPQRWRELCRSRLPAYMVPDRVLVVESVPATPSGKVDRAAVTQAAERMVGRPRREGRAAT